jgi:hypothetical protein
MATIHASSGQGALFELVARGVKDTYFVKDSKDSLFPYDARYESSVHHLAERKTMVPLADAAFGQTFEVEIDPYGDIMTECALEIDLPTWLPSLPTQPNGQATSPERANRLYSITDTNGNSYGYVNYVAYFLFEKIQFYQDQFLLQEWSGDGLLAKQMTEGSYNSSFLEQQQGGALETTDPTTGLVTTRGLQMRATPGHLRLVLPLPGMQCPGDGGFPLTAVAWQKFRIKGTLRTLEDLVVCSNSTIFKPAPWTVPTMRYLFDNGIPYTFSPLPRIKIEQPRILLSTIQHYVSPAMQQEIRSTIIEIPFRRQFDNQFTFGELDFIPLDKGGVAAITRRLDGRHPTERMIWFFRSQNVIDINRLDLWYNDYFDSHPTTAAQHYTTPYGEFYYNLKLNIAGKEREELFTPLVWNQINASSKDEKANGMHIGSMNWSTGDKYGTVYPAPRQPEGTINFTTADRPTLYIELANINTNAVLAQRKAEMRLFTEGWNVYIIKEGRGKLMFAS